MAGADQRNHAKAFLTRAQEHLACAEDDLAAERHNPAAGDAIHAGISTKDAIVTALTGSTSKGRDHGAAAKELAQALGKRPEVEKAARSLRELLSAKSEVEYGVNLVTARKAESLVRLARSLVEVGVQIIRLRR